MLVGMQGTYCRHGDMSQQGGQWLGCAAASGRLWVVGPASGSSGGVPEGLGMLSCMLAACNSCRDVQQVGNRGLVACWWFQTA